MAEAIIRRPQAGGFPEEGASLKIYKLGCGSVVLRAGGPGFRPQQDKPNKLQGHLHSLFLDCG